MFGVAVLGWFTGMSSVVDKGTWSMHSRHVLAGSTCVCLCVVFDSRNRRMCYKESLLMLRLLLLLIASVMMCRHQRQRMEMMYVYRHNLHSERTQHTYMKHLRLTAAAGRACKWVAWWIMARDQCTVDMCSPVARVCVCLCVVFDSLNRRVCYRESLLMLRLLLTASVMMCRHQRQRMEMMYVSSRT